MNMDFPKLITDVQKLMVDIGPVIADIEAIIHDFQNEPDPQLRKANGEIIKALLALVQQFASNPAFMQFLLTLLGGLVKAQEAQEAAAGELPMANGVLIKKLFELVQKFASNPQMLQIIMSLLGGLVLI
jgi:hypothetical protein